MVRIPYSSTRVTRFVTSLGRKLCVWVGSIYRNGIVQPPSRKDYKNNSTDAFSNNKFEYDAFVKSLKRAIFKFHILFL